MELWIVVAGVYMLAGVASFLLYGWDKRAAARQKRRVPEGTLHLVDLLGGWPGGFIAQRLFRHKTRKAGFQIVFWFTVLLHAAAWAAFFWWRH